MENNGVVVMIQENERSLSMKKDEIVMLRWIQTKKAQFYIYDWVFLMFL